MSLIRRYIKDNDESFRNCIRVRGFVLFFSVYKVGLAWVWFCVLVVFPCTVAFSTGCRLQGSPLRAILFARLFRNALLSNSAFTFAEGLSALSEKD